MLDIILFQVINAQWIGCLQEILPCNLLHSSDFWCVAIVELFDSHDGEVLDPMSGGVEMYSDRCLLSKSYSREVIVDPIGECPSGLSYVLFPAIPTSN